MNMTMKEPANNYAFIDSQNVNLAIRGQGWILDWKKFRRHLKETYGAQRVFLFLGYVDDNQSLYRFLEYAGYTIIFKPTLKDGQGFTKGNVDAELVLHAMIEYQRYDQAIIVTGDGDFYCLVDYLLKKEKLKRLLVPNVRKYSALLKQFAPNKIDFMNNLKPKLEYKNPP